MATAVPALDEPINALSRQAHRPWLAWLAPQGGECTLQSDGVLPSGLARIALQKGHAR
jgi:hypothetical protein